MALTPDVLRGGTPFLLDADVLREGISVHFDGLQRVPGSPALGDFHYAPVLLDPSDIFIAPIGPYFKS